MREQLGRIEGKLDIIVPAVTSHGRRISKVEKRQAWFSGGLAFIGVLWAGVVLAFTGK